MQNFFALSVVVWLSLVVVALGDDETPCHCPKHYKAYGTAACYHYKTLRLSQGLVAGDARMNRDIAIRECFSSDRGNMAFMDREDPKLQNWMIDELISSERKERKLVWIAFTRRNRPLPDVPEQWSWRDGATTRPLYEPNEMKEDADVCSYFSVSIDKMGKITKNDTSERNCKEPQRAAEFGTNVDFGLVCAVAYSPTQSYCPREMFKLQGKISQLKNNVEELRSRVSDGWKRESLLKVLVACLALLVVLVLICVLCRFF